MRLKSAFEVQKSRHASYCAKETSQLQKTETYDLHRHIRKSCQIPLQREKKRGREGRKWEGVGKRYSSPLKKFKDFSMLANYSLIFALHF